MNNLILSSLLLISITILLIFSSNNIIHSVNWFIFLILNISLLLMTLNFNFLALCVIIVHVGAIAILFLFAIMLLNLDTLITFSNNIWSNILLIISYFLILFSINVNHNNPLFEIDNNWSLLNLNEIEVLSYNLYNINSDLLVILTLILIIGLVGVLQLQLSSNPIQ